MNCVVCGEPITRDEKVWVCPEGLRHITCPPPADVPDVPDVPGLAETSE